ncbi:Kae1-associated serine/threonine protein kinase [Candidatus Woesearchaeota archaeon]|nr:Kae1-associated serine/threonine protein kinase [Candidatus Woesearchaeota archaeon]
MTPNKIAQGAEASIYLENSSIIKERFVKRYRLPQIDEALRTFRTRREAKILQKLEAMNFPAPHLQEFSDTRMSIAMDFIPGPKVRDILLDTQQYAQIAEAIGKNLAKLHDAQIVHGDLTTSNMLLHEQSKELTFIDFGLSAFSDKVEDKAVDLFLLDRALQSTHFQIYPGIFQNVLESYQNTSAQAAEVLARFEKVKARGRNKK